MTASKAAKYAGPKATNGGHLGIRSYGDRRQGRLGRLRTRGEPVSDSGVPFSSGFRSRRSQIVA